MAALAIKMNFDDEFVEFYNSFANNPKGLEYLELTGIQRKNLDLPKTIYNFFNNHLGDFSVNPNSSTGNAKNHVTYSHELANAWYKLMGLYKLWQQMKEDYGDKEANNLLKKIIIGTFYIHDSTKLLIPYCFACSTSVIMYNGRPYGPLQSMKPKRLRSFVGQVTEYAMDLSQEFAGAIALGDFLVNIAWYSYNEKLTDKQIENELQSFIHVCMNPFRIGGDPIFSNISIFDEPNLRNLFSSYKYPDGSSPLDEQYLKEIKRVQELFLKFMVRKDPITGLPYRFPVVTLNLFVEDGEIKDKEFLEMISEYNREGLFNVYITDSIAKLASCCRLQSNIADLMKFKGIDSFGNGGLNVGSHRIVTLNFYRFCRKNRNVSRKEFEANLAIELENATKILKSHRNLLKRLAEKGFLKFFKLGWINLDRMFFSTIGLIGIWEGLKELNIDLLKENGDLTKAQEYFTMLNNKVSELSNKYEMPINIEQIPGENAAVNLAKKDKIYFNDEKQKYLIYANQFVPLWEKVDLWKRAKVDGSLDRYFSGGLISHLNISQKVTKNQMKKLLAFAIECGLTHFALNPVYSQCKDCSESTLGKVAVCPKCNSENIEYLTRIVGYFTPVSSWNSVRRETEFHERKWQEL